jgi:HK97 gp10 family phage protein
MAANVRVVWDRAAITGLKTDPGVERFATEVAVSFAWTMRALAPHLTGEGAWSIQARDSSAKGARRVGWDKEHYYMGYQELGTKYVRGQRFVSKALRQYIHD